MQSLLFLSSAASLAASMLYAASNYDTSHDYCSVCLDLYNASLIPQPSAPLEETCGCQIGTVESFNDELSPFLNELLDSPFFRYYKINLDRPCTFWKDNAVCTSPGCSISLLPKDPINWESWLSDVQYPKIPSTSLFRAWEYDNDDFCLLDPEGLRNSGSYVDLIENPERFTGYAGPGAARVWAAVYEENCFTNPEAESNNPLSHTEWNQCTERKVFYRVISGLHASISTHLADEFFNVTTGQWERNFDIFHERVGLHLDRLQNMYLVFMLMCSAVSKITSRLEAMTFLPQDSTEDHRVHKLLAKISSNVPQLPVDFDHAVFSSTTSPKIIQDFKEHFKRVGKIMDCISCQRCRLWGKIQTTGVGTALKIIFNHGDPLLWSKMHLRRSEIIALYNTFGRLSESITAVGRFRTVYHQRLEDAKHSTNYMWKSLIEFLSSVKISAIGVTAMILIIPMGVARWCAKKKLSANAAL